ncbi:MAG TPA: signal peptidase I [Anaerolineae bacterium]|nr:signal peptidase I [Anaerolineae bacterium]
MEKSRPRQRILPPDARIIHPSQQPQRYSRALEYPTPSTASVPSATATTESLPAAVVKELVSTILPALIIAVFIHFFLAQATRVEGYSMEPTLYGHQRLIIEKVSYRLHGPKRGDIVVVRIPQFDRLLIKRVIGLPGETLEIRDGLVYINGQPLEEPYVNGRPRGSYPATTIPEGHVFVMGDNRNNSNDSRAFGPVPIENIVGHAWMRYWPLDEFGFMP